MEVVLKVVVAVFVASYMLETGYAIPPRDLAAASRRRPEIAAAVFVMLVVGPLLAYALVRTLDLDLYSAVALVLLSMTGVVPLASRMATHAKGDVPFALILTLVLGAIAPFSAPATARIIFGRIDHVIDIDVARLLVQLVLISGLPILAGIALRASVGEERARKGVRVARVVNTCAFGVVAVFLVIILLRAHALRSLTVTGAIAAVIFSLLISGIGYMFGGPAGAGRRTLAAIPNVPNVGLALLFVAGPNVAPPFKATILGMFVLRFAVGELINRRLARSAAAGGRAGTMTPGPT
jgi:BASS family bile acid:Na+ symporter